jgi:shikimate 5-dehydrogenase
LTRYFTFIGVTTGSSSMMQIFPRWRETLALSADIELAGEDLPLHAPAQRYRSVVERIKCEPDHLGAIVTTHKLDLFRAARDYFDRIDEYAQLCQEVSCFAKRDGSLHGWATDPITAGRSLEQMLPVGHFGSTNGQLLCFGAGGSGTAISLHFLRRAEAMNRPRKIIITDRSVNRLKSLRALHRRLGSEISVEYVLTGDSAFGDRLMAQLPPHSLVINATGMGKDSPGSPVTDAGLFPEAGIAWELNYRGELEFLNQAWGQRRSRGVRVEDGWQYFIYGWTAVMEEVFNRSISEEELNLLSAEAAFARPPLPTNSLPSPPNPKAVRGGIGLRRIQREGEPDNGHRARNT